MIYKYVFLESSTTMDLQKKTIEGSSQLYLVTLLCPLSPCCVQWKN